VTLCALPAVAVEPLSKTDARPADATCSEDADAARWAAKALRKATQVREAEQLVADATWFRKELRSTAAAPLASFARRAQSDPWQRYADLNTAFAGDDETYDSLVVHDGPNGLRLVVTSTMSLGDGSGSQEYVFARDGHLVQFARVESVWGDTCGDSRSELVWDFFTDQMIRQSFTVTWDDGSPLDADRKTRCPPLVRSDVEERVPSAVAIPWKRWSDVPVANQLAR